MFKTVVLNVNELTLSNSKIFVILNISVYKLFKIDRIDCSYCKIVGLEFHITNSRGLFLLHLN